MKKFDLDKYLEAYVYSYKLHKKQTRKGSNIPYFTHLSSVSNLIIENNGTTTQAIAGLLHDAVEDQGGAKTLAVIKRKFGPRVAKIVDQCSDTTIKPKPPWKKRKIKYIKDIKNKSQDTLLVSLCDKYHNANCILSDYQKVGEEIWDRFTASKQETFWYYESLYKEFKKYLKNHLELIKAYKNTVDEMKRIIQ
ncbi:MAG: HD domain-containing protein [Alphaproteobacteria bacterium]